MKELEKVSLAINEALNQSKQIHLKEVLATQKLEQAKEEAQKRSIMQAQEAFEKEKSKVQKFFEKKLIKSVKEFLNQFNVFNKDGSLKEFNQRLDVCFYIPLNNYNLTITEEKIQALLKNYCQTLNCVYPIEVSVFGPGAVESLDLNYLKKGEDFLSKFNRLVWEKREKFLGGQYLHVINCKMDISDGMLKKLLPIAENAILKEVATVAKTTPKKML